MEPRVKATTGKKKEIPTSTVSPLEVTPANSAAALAWGCSALSTSTSADKESGGKGPQSQTVGCSTSLPQLDGSSVAPLQGAVGRACYQPRQIK